MNGAPCMVLPHAAASVVSVQANDNGDYFPLWGICLGFEMLGYLAADEDISILTSTDSENLPVPITFTKSTCYGCSCCYHC